MQEALKEQIQHDFPITTTARQKVENTLTDELIIGICAPIGSLRDPFIESLKHILDTDFGYEVRVIKLSAFIGGPICEPQRPGRDREDVRVYLLMNKIAGGDELRERYTLSVLAGISCAKELPALHLVSCQLAANN